LRALRAALGSPERTLRVGTVKTNLGHLEGASGVAGLLKAVLAVREGVLPPHLNLRTPTPHADWDGLEAPDRLLPWPGPRVAGVSAFGLAGTNVHLVVEEPPARPEIGGEPAGPHRLALSARDPEALRRLAARWARWLREHPEASL